MGLWVLRKFVILCHDFFFGSDSKLMELEFFPAKVDSWFILSTQTILSVQITPIGDWDKSNQSSNGERSA